MKNTKLIKTISSKAQSTLNQLSCLTVFTILIGLAGSYETNRINGIQLTQQLITTACVGFTAYILLSYVNIMIADKLNQMHSNKNNGLYYTEAQIKDNNKNLTEIA